MPVLASSAYNTAEDVLNLTRAIINDSEVAGGDVLTDTAPFTFTILNGGYARVQLELAKAGIETAKTEWWLIGLPSMPTVDPEARMVIDDTGCNILYPDGAGDVFSMVPQLPVNLVFPFDLYERQTDTVYEARKMRQSLTNIPSANQDLYLIDWQWQAEGLRTRGALQSQDLKIVGEQTLPQLAATTDPVPIRGVLNAAAYFAAMIFSEGRDGEVAPTWAERAQEEIFLRIQVNARRRQHRPVRRRPYSSRGARRW
jgi:hypothetical protein